MGGQTVKVNMVIDYLTFTFRPLVMKTDFDFDFVTRFLGLNSDDFFETGGRNHYAKSYTSNNGISIMLPSENRKDMGICVSMSGTGCRYYEQHMKDGEFCKNGEVWRDFFRRLRSLVDEHYKVNITRIDIACDDKSETNKHFLDLDVIEASTNAREFVSQFQKVEEITTKTIIQGKVLGKCIYFGSMKSDTMCRFYDKLAEQKMKYKTDRERLKEFANIKHWVRMEFVFRREQAVKIVNAICDSSNFSQFFAEVVNGCIRFIERCNLNVSRCPLKKWWLRFIGTVKRTKLAVSDFKPYSFQKLRNYYLRNLSTTVCTLMHKMEPAEFFELTQLAGMNRLKGKHKKIISGIENDVNVTMSEWWSLLNPINPGRCQCSC